MPLFLEFRGVLDLGGLEMEDSEEDLTFSEVGRDRIAEDVRALAVEDDR